MQIINPYFKKAIRIIFYCMLGTVFLTAGKQVYPVLAIDANEDGDRIVAIVNDDIIVLSELSQRLQPYEQQVKSMAYPPEKEKETLFQLREKVLNQMIDEKLMDEEIKKQEITLEDKEVNATIERIKKQSYFTDEELRKALAEEGLTMDAYRQQVKEELLRSKLINREVRSKVVITPEDVQSYYDQHKEKYGSKTKYHLRHILMKFPAFADANRKREIRNRMEEIINRLKKGASFEEMANLYSESSTAEDGGDLGEFELDTLSNQIKTAVAQLKPGEFTPVLETDQGFQIFQVQNIINAPGKPMSDVHEEIQNILYNEMGNQKYLSWTETLRKQAHIKIIR